MARKAKASMSKAHKPDDLVLPHCEEDDRGKVLAEVMLGQNLRHGYIASTFAGGMLQSSGDTLEFMDCAKVVQQNTGEAIKGDLSFASAMLASQAMTLDSMFTEFARRAAINMGEYISAAERYGRLALKAQSNCRATLEALAKLHQPREQTVRHVHVNEGGQAVIADQFHHHGGGHRNAESAEQPHAAGTGAAGSGPAMLGHDETGKGLPVPGDQGREAMPDARRKGQRRT
jgi:hypothetical protein